MKFKISHIHYFVLLLTITAGIFFTSCKTTEPEHEVPVVKRYVESINFQSKMLKRPVRYSIYLPADYGKSTREYATVYLLHGYGDDETAWVKDGKIDKIIDELEKNGTIAPMIYVIPQGYNSYYVNRFNGTLEYMKMFTEEFVPMIDSLYRTKKDATQRAVVGYSMGGYGALILPAKNPDIFSVSVPLSMSFRTDEQYMLESQSVFDTQWGPIFGATGSTGNARLTDYYLEYSPFHFFEKENAGSFSSLRFFIDCGDDEESLSLTNNAMHALLRNKNIAHEYRMKNGAHTWDYWRAAMREALPYIQSCFSGSTYPAEPVFAVSEAFAGSLEQKTYSGLTLNIDLPVNYSSSKIAYPVLYFYHKPEGSRLAETKNVMAVLDSLQNEKPFILVEIDADQITQHQIDFNVLVSFIDTQYRTKTKVHNRIGLGNLSGGETIYDASVLYPSLLYSVFLFDASLETDFDLPQAKFIYLDCTDQAVNFEAMQQLYVQCRNRDIDHQFRVRNGKNSFNSFLNGLENSIVYIGLMLNKL